MDFKSLENLNLTADCLKNKGSLPEHLQAWLSEGLNRWQLGVSLMDALGISDCVIDIRQGIVGGI